MVNEGMPEQEKQARRRRVENLKKLIILLIITFILVPVFLCVFLSVRVNTLLHEIEHLNTLIAAQSQSGTEQSMMLLESENDRLSGETEDAVSYLGEETSSEQSETDVRKVYLTFDDGPSTYTGKILDILDEYNVKATFFVVGKTDEASLDSYKRIVEEGHTLGMHSYSHKYGEIYKSVDAYAEDLTKLQEHLYLTTGVWSRFCRFPGGSSNTVSQVDMDNLIDYLNEQGITYFDWNISSGDAAKGYVSMHSIVDNVMCNIEKHNNCVVLMHDAADKLTTVEALPVIIEQLLDMENTEILAITDDTIPVQHVTSQKEQ